MSTEKEEVAIAAVSSSLGGIPRYQGPTFDGNDASKPNEKQSVQYAPDGKVNFEYDDTTDFDLSLSLRAKQKPCDDRGMNMLNSWDITEIEGINSKANDYLGPSQSTGVHDLVTVARRTSVKDDSILGTVEEQRNDVIPVEDEVLDGGDFSAMLARNEFRSRKIDFQPVSQCQARQNLGSLSGLTKTVELPISANEVAPTNDFRKPESTGRHIPNLFDIKKSSSFAIGENKPTSFTENPEFSAVVNEELQAPVRDAKENCKFSIFEDDGDIIESSNVRKGLFDCTDSGKICPKNMEFSIFEDVHATAAGEHSFLKPRDKPAPSHLKRQPCKDLTPFAEHKQARVDPLREPPPSLNTENTREARFDPLWMPSPTVHTKKAKQDILAMFNMPLECEKSELSINFTEEITRGIDQQVNEQKEVAPERKGSALNLGLEVLYLCNFSKMQV